MLVYGIVCTAKVRLSTYTWYLVFNFSMPSVVIMSAARLSMGCIRVVNAWHRWQRYYNCICHGTTGDLIRYRQALKDCVSTSLSQHVDIAGADGRTTVFFLARQRYNVLHGLLQACALRVSCIDIFNMTTLSGDWLGISRVGLWYAVQSEAKRLLNIFHLSLCSP